MNDDIPALLFALSSCAIEGSELAIKLLELKDKDPDLTLQKCRDAITEYCCLRDIKLHYGE